MRLAVNIDHIATIREARKADEPDPITAAAICELAGAEGITVHLRSDRRHIQDRDVEILQRTVSTYLNVEMAATEEMLTVVERISPRRVTLVPEKPHELTTEGGLDVAGRIDQIREATRRLLGKGMDVSLFIDPDRAQVEASIEAGAPRIEINTGRFANEWRSADAGARELKIVAAVASDARERGLSVFAGHGLTYRNIDGIARIEAIEELNIGHSIVARAALVGLERAVREMIALMQNPRS